MSKEKSVPVPEHVHGITANAYPYYYYNKLYGKLKPYNDKYSELEAYSIGRVISSKENPNASPVIPNYCFTQSF